VVKAKAVKLAYGRALPLTASVKQSTASSGFVTTLPLAIKTRSPSPSPRVYFSDVQACSSTPLANSKVIYYNCERPGHYTATCTNPQKPSADLSELERAIEQDSTIEDFKEQRKGEL
jgi:hypothetical protein